LLNSSSHSRFPKRKLARENTGCNPPLRSTADSAWQTHTQRKSLPPPYGRSAAEELDIALWLEERGGDVGFFYILFIGKGIFP